MIESNERQSIGEVNILNELPEKNYSEAAAFEMGQHTQVHRKLIDRSTGSR